MTEGDRPAEIDELVDRTSGPQPMRRLFHAFNGSALATLLIVFAPPKWPTVAALAAIFVLLLVFDLVRLRNPSANRVFFSWFRHLASPREAAGLASSTWYALAMVISLAAFPWPAAISGILVMALADPAASYVGRRWGRRPFLGGSVLGFTVFVAVALVILVLRHPVTIAVPVALVAAVAERRHGPFDDNFAVPLVTAAAITLLGAIA